jgi:hypothetical protein
MKLEVFYYLQFVNNARKNFNYSIFLWHEKDYKYRKTTVFVFNIKKVVNNNIKK